MTIYVENETDFTFPFDTKELCSRVAEAVLDAEGCPYETEINVLITDNEGIRLYNKEYRNIDRETDVLSFPNIPFETEADFSIVEENCSDYFQPDSGELSLGDIILSVDRFCCVGVWLGVWGIGSVPRRKATDIPGNGSLHSSLRTACCICAVTITKHRRKRL